MKAKVSVSVDESLLAALDQLVERKVFESRSSAFEASIAALRAYLADQEFAANLELLDVSEERAEAELGMADYATLVSEGVGEAGGWQG